MGAATKPTRQPRRKSSVSRRGLLALMMAPVMDKATRLDREADNALAWGQHQRAERLAQRAAELRGWSA